MTDKITGVYFIRDFVATPEEQQAAKAMGWDVLKYANASFVTGQESVGSLIKADYYSGAVPEIYRRWLESGQAGPDRKLVGSPPADYTGGKPTRLSDGSMGWPFGAIPIEGAPASASEPTSGGASKDPFAV